MSLFIGSMKLPSESLGFQQHISISGLVVEYIVAIDVTRARFPADAFSHAVAKRGRYILDFVERMCTQTHQSTDAMVV